MDQIEIGLDRACDSRPDPRDAAKSEMAERAADASGKSAVHSASVVGAARDSHDACGGCAEDARDQCHEVREAQSGSGMVNANCANSIIIHLAAAGAMIVLLARGTLLDEQVALFRVGVGYTSGRRA